MKIGIPKALLFHKYNTLWESFFEYLEIDTITSPNSNKEILETGIKYSHDEACLSLKLFLGHVKYLANKCDYILIPRIESLKKKEKTCTNFMALYDIVENTFNVKILNYNIDVKKGYDEVYAFINIATNLGISKIKAIKAYRYAKEKELESEKEKIIKQESNLTSNNLKILIAGHPYNLYDELIGTPIIKYLKQNNVIPIFSDICKKDYEDYNTNGISKDIYWTYNKDIFSSINHYLNKIDGIILLSTFPCGPDSLCNEMIIRKIKNKPIITIIVDELNNDAGLITRLESFIEILKDKKESEIYE